MKNLLLLLTCILYFIINTEAQINFTSYQTKQQQQAKKSNQLILIKFTASWCGACKMMQKNVLSQKAVGDYFNKNFICTQVDVDKDKIANDFDVSGIPAFVFMNGEGKVVYQTEGYQEAEDFLETGRLVLAKHNGTLTVVEELGLCYQEGDLNCQGKLTAFLQKDTWKTKEGALVILLFASEGSELAMNHFEQNKTTIAQLAGQEEVDLFLMDLALYEVSSELDEALENKREPKWALVEKAFKKQLENRYLPYLLDLKSTYFYIVNQWVQYVDYAAQAANERAATKSGNAKGEVYLKASLDILEDEMEYENDISDAQEIAANKILYKLLKNAEQHLDTPTAELYDELAMACSILDRSDEEDYYDELALEAAKREKNNH